MEEKRTTKIKNIILWWISTMLILYTLMYIGDATPQAICFGILAVLLMPPVNKKINEKLIKGNKKNKIIKIVTEVLAFFVIVANLPANNANQNYDKNNAIETTSKINTNITNVLNETNASITNINTNEISTNKELESNNSTSINTSTSTKKTTTQSTSATTTDNSRTVYVTPTGKRYHYISTCGGKNSTASTLNKAKARGLTPCQKCAKLL